MRESLRRATAFYIILGTLVASLVLLLALNRVVEGDGDDIALGAPSGSTTPTADAQPATPREDPSPDDAHMTPVEESVHSTGIPVSPAVTPEETPSYDDTTLAPGLDLALEDAVASFARLAIVGRSDLGLISSNGTPAIEVHSFEYPGDVTAFARDLTGEHCGANAVESTCYTVEVDADPVVVFQPGTSFFHVFVKVGVTDIVNFIVQQPNLESAIPMSHGDAIAFAASVARAFPQ